MEEDFNPIGNGMPGWTLEDSCPIPPPFTAKEAFIFRSLRDTSEYGRYLKLVKLIAIIDDKIGS